MKILLAVFCAIPALFLVGIYFRRVHLICSADRKRADEWAKAEINGGQENE